MIYAISFGRQIFMSQDKTELVKVLNFIDVNDCSANLLKSAEENVGMTIGTYSRCNGEPVLVQAFKI